MSKIGTLILLMSALLPLFGCPPKAVQALKPVVDECGCAVPSPTVFEKAGITLETVKVKLKALDASLGKLETRPEVQSLASQAAIDETLFAYIRCRAINCEKLGADKVAYFERMSRFSQSNPTPADWLEWYKANPPPWPQTSINTADLVRQAYAVIEEHPEQAEAIAKQILVGDARSLDGLRLLADSQIIAKKYALARETIGRMAQIETDCGECHLALAQVALYQARGQSPGPEQDKLFDEAIREGGIATEKRPNDARGWHVLSEAHFRRSGAEAGLMAGRRAAELNRDDVQIQLDAGELNYQLAKFADSLPYFYQAVRLQPQRAQAQLRLGQTLVQLHRSRDGLDHLRVSTDADARTGELKKNASVAWRWRGRAELEIGDVESALSSFRKGLSLNPSDVAAMQYLGRTLIDQGQVLDGRAQFEKAIRECDRLHRDADDVRENFAGALVIAAQAQRAPALADEALIHLRVVESHKPDDATVQANIAGALTVSGDVQGARRLLERLAKQWPENCLVRANLGHAKLNNREYEAAAVDYRFIVDHGDQSPMVIVGLARCLVCQKRWQEASEMLQRATAIPDDTLARQSLTTRSGITYGESPFVPSSTSLKGPVWLMLANVQIVLDDLTGADVSFDKATIHGFGVADTFLNAACVRFLVRGAEPALEMVKAGLSKHPNEPDLLFHRGVYELSLGQTAAAQETFRSLTDKPGSSLGWRGLGLCYAALGDLERASESFQKAIELDKDDALSKRNLDIVGRGNASMKDFDVAMRQELRASLKAQVAKPCP